MPTEDARFNPFPGLRPFQYGEQHLFFGREGQSEEILRRLTEHRFLAVVGTSGSGKSSLIRAGLLPDLHGGFMSGAGSHWRTAVFRPIGDPIGNLARALNTPEVLQTDPASGDDQARSNLLLEVTLRRSSLGLIDAVRLARLPKEDNLLVVVDQFEELFRFANAANTPAQADDAAAFVKLLLEATWQAETPIYIVITMRSDFIGDCARFPDLAENVTAGMYLIPRMTREQRRSAIADPVGVGGGCISIRLVNRLLNEVGDNPDQLPVLQHSLMRTWEHWVMRTPSAESYESDPIDLVDYEAIGGLTHALSNHADEAFNALPSDRHREIAKRMFRCLTEKGADNREIRRPTSVATLGIVAGASKNEVVEVIREFHKQGRSFLTVPSEGELSDDALIDISHESLIRLWERLRGWVEEEAESARMYKRLADAAAMQAGGKGILWDGPLLQSALAWKKDALPTAEWAQRYDPDFDQAMAFLEKSRQAHEEAEREKKRQRDLELHRTRRNLVVVSICSVLALLLAAYAFKERAKAVRAETDASAHAAEAERERNLEAKMADDNWNQALREQQEHAGAVEEEISYLDELIKKSTPYEAVRYHRDKSALLIEQGRLEDAAKEAQAAIDLAPDSPLARTDHGYALLLLNHPKEALADFEYMRDHIDSKNSVNYLNLTISLAQLQRDAEALDALKKAIWYSEHGEDSGGSESMVPPELKEVTGRTTVYGNSEIFRQAMYFLKPVLDAYSGRKEFASDLKEAQDYAKPPRIRPSEKKNAALMAITWAWFLEFAKTPNYGLTVAQGALWEEADYPVHALRHYDDFLKTHSERKEARYEDLAQWVLSAKSRIGHPTSLARGVSPAAMEVESDLLKAKGEYSKAEELVSGAIRQEPENVRLYFKRMDVHYGWAQQAMKEARDAQHEADGYTAKIKEIDHPPASSKADTQVEAENTKAAQSAQEKEKARLELEKKRKTYVAEQTKAQEKANGAKQREQKLYREVIEDCNVVLAKRGDSAEAYFERGEARYRLEESLNPELNAGSLTSEDPIVRDLKRTLELNPTHFSAMDWLSYVTSSKEAAVEWRRKTDRFYPGLTWNLYQIAELQNKLGRFADAFDTIQRAIRIDPTNYNYYKTRAEAEKGLGYSERQIQYDQAEGDRVAEEFLRRRGQEHDLEDADNWGDDHWRLLSKLAEEPAGEDVRCNSDMTTCVTSRVTKGLGEWALFGIDSVKEAGQDTRFVDISKGKNEGVVVGSNGEVYARYSYDEKDKRSVVKIGTAEVVSVEPETAMVKVKMPKPEGDSLVREGDVVGLYFRTPKIDHRSPLWSVLKFNISFADSSDKTIADFDTLYSKESPELDHTLYQKMLNDIHEYGRVKGDSLNDGKPVSKGKLAAKPMKVRDALEAATQEDLDRFFKYVVKVPRTFFGYKWRVGVFYEWWVEQGMPED